MAWKGPCAVGERLQLVELVRSGVTVTEAAELFGVSRKTAHKWLERARTDGVQHGLEDRSRARREQARFEGRAVELLTKLRKEHRFWGPRTLLAVLARTHPRLALPAASTAGVILKRAGLVVPRVRQTRFGLPYAVGDTQPVEANDRWTADFKGHFLMRNGQQCHPLTLRDATSRMVLAIRGFKAARTDFVIGAFEEAFHEYGLPREVHTDTGVPFGTTGLARLSSLSVFLLKLGIRPVFSRPGKPQDNGGHERMHRDLKAETTRPPGFDLADQQRKFDVFRQTFNDIRPHHALGRMTPRTQWKPSPRRYAGKPPSPTYPGHFEVRRVDASGAISFHANFVPVTLALAGEPVGLEPIDDGVWDVHFASMRIGVLDERQAKPRVMGVNRPAATTAVEEKV
jgi:transposase InsO family protein